jgi:hypothetical protein
MKALERLRAANPVPVAERVGDEELLARIMAVPREAAPGKRRRRRLRRAIVLAPAAAILLGSSAFGLSTWLGGKAVKPPVTRAEYARAQHQLTLPPGYRWPVLRVEGNSMTTVGGGGGHAVVIAQNAWECYWVDAIRHGDAAAGRRAHAVLDDLTTRHVAIAPDGAPEDWVPAHPPAQPYAVFADDGGLQWIRENYRLAAAGDPTRLMQSCRANRPASG